MKNYYKTICARITKIKNSFVVLNLITRLQTSRVSQKTDIGKAKHNIAYND